jgi:hypothetical protein
VPADDLSKAWQLRSDKTKEELFQLGANIYLYSVREKSGGYKGDTYVVRDNPEAKPQRAIKVARLLLGDNPDPEPGGWRRLAALMKNAGVANVTVEAVRPDKGKLQGYKVAHLTGTTTFKLPEPARAEIKSFVDAGGTLVIDAAGASSDFADSAVDAMVSLFGEPARKAATQPLSPNHPLFTLPEMGVQKFDYRNFARGKVVGKLNAPRLAGIESNGRVVCFFSREDLSGSLVGQPVDGILGYSTDTATALMRNVLAYADTGGKGYPPKPKEDPKAKDKPAQAAAAPAAKSAKADAKPAKAGANPAKARAEKTAGKPMPAAAKR